MEVGISQNAVHELDVGKRLMIGSLGDIVDRTMEQVMERESVKKGKHQ